MTDDLLTHPADASWKLAFLLQIPLASRVIVGAGDATSRLVSGLANLGYEAIDYRTEAASQLKGVKAVIILPDTEIPLPAFERMLKGVAPDAQICAFFRNRWGVLAGVRSGLRGLFSPASSTITKVSGILGERAIGASWWMPLPRFVNAEEFVLSSAREEVASSLGLSSVRWAAIRSQFHEAFGVYKSNPESGIPTLERKLEESLKGKEGAHDLRISRFDLRERGVLVLLLSDSASGQNLVCRVVRGEEGARSLQRHWEFQELVRASARNAPGVNRLLPVGVGAVQIGDHRGWVEERSPGTVSWRMPRRYRDSIDGQLVGFLSELATLEPHARRISRCDLERERGIWSDQIRTRLRAVCATAAQEALEVALPVLLDQEAHFCWVHGDFGYGNALAMPDGRLSAIIDWETASEGGLAGIDFFNFLLQRARTLGARGVADASDSLIALIGRCELGNAVCGAKDFVERFIPTQRAQLTLMGLALRRLMLREHRYESPSRYEVADMVEALERWRSAFEGSGCQSSRRACA